MAVELERVVLPEYADVKIEVSVSARINITGVAAQRKVGRLLLDLVGTQLYGAPGAGVLTSSTPQAHWPRAWNG